MSEIATVESAEEDAVDEDEDEGGEEEEGEEDIRCVSLLTKDICRPRKGSTGRSYSTIDKKEKNDTDTQRFFCIDLGLHAGTQGKNETDK